jgi:hypothetical protein
VAGRIIIAQVVAHAGEDEGEGPARLLDERQTFDQGTQIGRCRIERNQDQVGGGEQLRIGRAYGRCGIDEQIGSAGGIERVELGCEVGERDRGIPRAGESPPEWAPCRRLSERKNARKRESRKARMLVLHPLPCGRGTNAEASAGACSRMPEF